MHTSKGFLGLLFVLFFVLITSTANAVQVEVTLAWDANSEDNLAGYKLYYNEGEDGSGAPYSGENLTEGTSPITILTTDLDDSSAPVYTLTGLEYETEYFFALTAFNTDGLESDYSDEVAYTTGSIPVYTIEAAVDSTEGGSIYPTGTLQITAWETQAYTITPDNGWRISDVLVDGESVGAVAVYTFTEVSGDHTITAVFENPPLAPTGLSIN